MFNIQIIDDPQFLKLIYIYMIDNQGNYLLMRAHSEDSGFQVRSSIWDKYNRVTTLTRLSKCYVSNITKTMICRFLEIKRKVPLEEINGTVDLCAVLEGFQDLWGEIFQDEFQAPESEIVYKEGLSSAINLCYSHPQASIFEPEGRVSYGLNQETDPIVFGVLPKIIFEMEKQVLIDYLMVGRPQTITVRWNPTGRCHLCRSRWNFKYEDRDQLACSNEDCLGHRKRQSPDWVFLQNHSFIVGFSQKTKLSQEVVDNVSKQFFELNKIQLLPEGQTNNLTQQVQNPGGWNQSFRCNQFIKWRGSLVGRTLATDMAPIPYRSGHAIIHAINNYNRLPLKIEKVGWIQGIANRGVIALKQIPNKTVITTYVGEMYLGSQYPFWIHQDSAVHWGWHKNDQILLFPFETANVGRFLNGSETPESANVETRWTLVEGSSSLLFKGTNLPCLHLVMISLRKIKAGQELRWFYGQSFNQANGIGNSKK